MNTDPIQKEILLRAPLKRVWKALSDSAEFGTWFGMKIAGPFVAGTKVDAMIVPTKVDAQVAAKQKPHEGTKFDLFIDRIEPENLFSFRWHPFAIEPGKDYSAEPTTLVEFTLREVPEGVQLTVTESGFDLIPIERRAKAFAANDGGWSMVITLLQKYVEGPYGDAS